MEVLELKVPSFESWNFVFGLFYFSWTLCCVTSFRHTKPPDLFPCL